MTTVSYGKKKIKWILYVNGGFRGEVRGCFTNLEASALALTN